MFTEEQIQELFKCFRSPEYFVSTYFKLQSDEPFILYPEHEAYLRYVNSRDRSIIKADRQTGLTTISAAYALWKLLFEVQHNILSIHSNISSLKAFRDIIKYAYDNLPVWMQAETHTNNKFEMRTKHSQNRLLLEVGTEHTGRGFSINTILVNDASRYRKYDVYGQEEKGSLLADMVQNLLPALISNNGKFIISDSGSSPHTTFDLIWDEWDGERFTLPWTLFPYRGTEFIDNIRACMSADTITREFGIGGIK